MHGRGGPATTDIHRALDENDRAVRIDADGGAGGTGVVVPVPGGHPAAAIRPFKGCAKVGMRLGGL